MGEQDYWRVSLSIDPSRHDEILNAARATMPSERVDVVSTKSVDENDDFGVISLAVMATSEAEAREEAVAAFQRIMELAGLPAIEPVVVGVLTPFFAPDPHDGLLQEAIRLAIDDRNELAVLRAHTAAEMYGKLAFRALFERRLSTEWKKDAHRVISPGLSDRRSRNVFELLIGSRPESQSWWEEYSRHLERRHAIAHDGLSVSREDAGASLDAVRAFIQYVRNVWAGEVPSADHP